MIVKILDAPSNPGKKFDGVRYNTNKVLREKGELLVTRNFGALDGLAKPRPQDYINYLEAWSDRSKRIKQPQFHVVLSAKGRETDKHGLCELAEKWLLGRGYGDNPYLLIFHKDTANNHLHIVTTRVGPDGKKIDDSFERKKAYTVLNELMQHEPQQALEKDLAQALAYRFATRAQFLMLLEAKGYSLKLVGERYRVYKYGKSLGEVAPGEVDARIRAYDPGKDRIYQLRAIVHKYQSLFSPALYPIREPLPGGGEGRITGYASELTDYLREPLGLEFIFHAKNDQPPYGYTLIDHAQKTVYKGGLLMPLAELTVGLKLGDAGNNESKKFYPESGGWPVGTTSSEATGEPYNADDQDSSLPPESLGSETYNDVPPLRIDIAGDIDDEQILGRNRRRKRKARTNSR